MNIEYLSLNKQDKCLEIRNTSKTWLSPEVNFTDFTDFTNMAPGANFTNRLKLDQLSLCVRFEPPNRLKSVCEIGPWGQFHETT